MFDPKNYKKFKRVIMHGKYTHAHVWKNKSLKVDKKLIQLINHESLQGCRIDIIGNGLTVELKDRVAPSILGSDICQNVFILEFIKKDLDINLFNGSIQHYKFKYEGYEYQYRREYKEALKEFSSIRCPMVAKESFFENVINNDTINLYKNINKNCSDDYYLVIKLDIQNLGKQIYEYYQNIAVEYNKTCPYLIGHDKENYMHDVEKVRRYTEQVAYTLSNIFLDMLEFNFYDEEIFFSSASYNTIGGDLIFKNCFYLELYEWTGVPVNNNFYIVFPEQTCIIPYESNTNNIRRILKKITYIDTKITPLCSYKFKYEKYSLPKFITVTGKYTNAKIWQHDLIKTDNTLLQILDQEYIQNCEVEILGNGLAVELNNKVAPSLLGSDICQGVLIKQFEKNDLDINLFNTSIHEYNFHQTIQEYSQIYYNDALRALASIRCPLSNKEYYLGKATDKDTVMLYNNADNNCPNDYYLVIKSDIQSLGKEIFDYYQKLAIKYNKDCPYLVGQEKEDYIHDVIQARSIAENHALALSILFLAMLETYNIRSWTNNQPNSIDGRKLYKNCLYQYLRDWIAVPQGNNYLIIEPKQNCIIPYEWNTNSITKILEEFAWIDTKITPLCIYQQK